MITPLSLRIWWVAFFAHFSACMNAWWLYKIRWIDVCLILNSILGSFFCLNHNIFGVRFQHFLIANPSLPFGQHFLPLPQIGVWFQHFRVSNPSLHFGQHFFAPATDLVCDFSIFVSPILHSILGSFFAPNIALMFDWPVNFLVSFSPHKQVFSSLCEPIFKTGIWAAYFCLIYCKFNEWKG